MFAVSLRYGKTRHDAEEILQEAFIKVFSTLHQFRDEGSLEGWIRRITVTTALQRIRSRTPLHALVSFNHELDGELPNEDVVESNLNARELLELLRTLPEAYRLVFNLYVLEGFQHKEIAAMLRISEGTSKSNLHDARKWLRNRIGNNNNTQEPKRKYL